MAKTLCKGQIGGYNNTTFNMVESDAAFNISKT